MGLAVGELPRQVDWKCMRGRVLLTAMLASPCLVVRLIGNNLRCMYGRCLYADNARVVEA